MSVQRQIRFWLAALVVAALTLYLLREVLLPFVAGMALAYVLDPIVDRLERLGLGRLGASILILALFILTFVLALVVLIPLVAHQLAGFGANLPAYVERIQALIAEQSGPLIDKLGGAGALPDMQQSIGGLVRQGAAWMAGFLVDSSGRRNTAYVSCSEELVQSLGRCSPAQGLARPGVEGDRHSGEVVGAVHAE